MELIVRDLKECYEYPEEFDDYSHRYVLEKVISRKGNGLISAMSLGYSDIKEDFEYIVECVNEKQNKESFKREYKCTWVSNNDINIEQLDLSVRIYNALKRSGINSISQVLNKTDEELLSIRNLNERTLAELKRNIRQYQENNIYR
jgi:DNA-directed RNA polymerase subunit alpha